MDRWAGILKVPLHPDSSSFYRVAASLCLSSSKGLAVPSANAIFFNGDRVEGTGNPVIERLSNLQNISQILVSKFGDTVNAWVIEAPAFNGPFAIYKDFVPNVNQNGEPISYDATGFPTSSSIVLLLYNCLKEAKSSIFSEKEQYHAESPPSSPFNPKTIVLGFSKGGTVVNQLVTELGLLEVQHAGNGTQPRKKGISVGRAIQEEDQFIPTSAEGLLNSIAEIHYVDVGLNTEGAYLTNQDVFERLSEHLQQRPFGIRFLLHGTPRQWSDSWRIWIRKEKDEMVRLLKLAARKNTGKLIIRERLYFLDRPPSIQMHFEIIENLDVS